MTNPTSNYGFVLPTATDLVTDLPADFEVALQGVDTRLKALQPGTTLGDLAYSSATANTNTRLPVGSNGQVLAVVAGVPAWQNGTTGDIEGVTAGVGITGGGTSGTVTVTNDMATTITASGDIVIGTGSGTYDNLPIGTTGQILTADTTVSPYKVKWATSAAGGMTLLETGSLTGASVTTASLSQSYVNLFVVLRDWYPSVDDERCRLRVNGVSAANSYSQGNQTTVVGSNSFGSDYMGLSIGADNTVHSNLITIDIPDYTNSSTFKLIYSNAVNVEATTTSNFNMYFRVYGVVKATTAISTLTFFPGSGNFSGGTYFVYGVK